MPMILVCPTCQHAEPIGAQGEVVLITLGPEISPGVFQKLDAQELSAFDAARAGLWIVEYMNKRLELLADEYDRACEQLAAYEIRPCDENKIASHAPFVASSIRSHFHRPECEYAQTFLGSKRCEVYQTHEEAVATGRKPCKTCRA